MSEHRVFEQGRDERLCGERVRGATRGDCRVALIQVREFGVNGHTNKTQVLKLALRYFLCDTHSVSRVVIFAVNNLHCARVQKQMRYTAIQ